jgi:iron(III) transport system permease protein
VSVTTPNQYRDTTPGRLLARRLFTATGANGMSIIVGIAIAALVLPLVFTVVYSSFVHGGATLSGALSLKNYTAVFQGSGLTAIENSLIFAAASAVLCVALASLVAFFVERTNAPFRKLVYFTVVMALGVPIVVETIGWVLLIGPNASFANTVLHGIFGNGAPTVNIYSWFWLIIVQALVTFPALFLLVAPAFRMADPALEQAASVSGANTFQTLRKVTLPLVRPSLLAAVLLSFVVGLEMFEVPALIGTPSHIQTLSTSMYTLMDNSVAPDYDGAAAYAVLLMVLTVFGLYMYQRATRKAHRFVTVTGKGYRPHKIDLQRLRWPAGLVTLFVPLIVLSPVLMLFWASFRQYYSQPAFSQFKTMSLTNYHTVLNSSTGFVSALKNTLELGIGAALLVMIVALIVAWGVLRRPSLLTRSVDQVGNLPLVVPGIVLSLAVLRVFISFPIPVYGTIWIIYIALIVHLLPWGMRYTHAGLISLHGELEEAASISGASRLRTFVQIIIPIMRPTLFAGGLFVFMATMQQLSLVIFLSSPNVNVISTWIWDIWNNAEIAQASTAAIISVVPIVVLAALFYRFSGIGRDDSLAAANAVPR